MAIATQVAPIKIGVLIDFVLPPPSAWNIRDDFLEATRLTFDDAVAAGRLDRPVELVVRECEGVPRGVRAHDLGERGAAARGDRGPLQGAGDLVVRRRRVARRVDVLTRQRL